MQTLMRSLRTPVAPTLGVIIHLSVVQTRAFVLRDDPHDLRWLHSSRPALVQYIDKTLREDPATIGDCTAAGPHSSETSGVEVQITCLVKNALVLRSASELATRSASSTSPLYLCWIRRPLYGAPTGLNLRIAAQYGTSRSENMRTAVQQHFHPSPYAASHPGRTSHRGPQDKTPC